MSAAGRETMLEEQIAAQACFETRVFGMMYTRRPQIAAQATKNMQLEQELVDFLRHGRQATSPPPSVSSVRCCARFPYSPFPPGAALLHARRNALLSRKQRGTEPSRCVLAERAHACCATRVGCVLYFASPVQNPRDVVSRSERMLRDMNAEFSATLASPAARDHEFEQVPHTTDGRTTADPTYGRIPR
jgi:hypothetical protein